MKAYARPIIVTLAAVALVAASWSLYYHHQLSKDSSYTGVCDVSASVSCTDVLRSEYATQWGIPVAAGGAIWAGLVLLLAAGGMGSRDKVRASAAAGYVFVLSVVGLAAVFYWGYASFVVLKTYCLLCIAMYVSVIGIFLTSSSATDISLASLPGRLLPDLRRALTQPVTAILAVLWLAGSTGLVAFFQSSGIQSAVAAPPVAAPPEETLDAGQLAEWHAWLDRQPRHDQMGAVSPAKVRLVKFNDYQCPSCRMTWIAYRQTIEKYEAQHPGVFVFETRDFPLELECGIGNAGHGGACEGAVAVRLAKVKGRGPEMETWLYEHQAEMTRDAIENKVRDIAGVEDFDAQYPKVLEDVRKDAQLGKGLGVTGTPTFFLNGIRMPSLRISHLDAAIAYELQKAGVTSAAQ
jgi:uncharacterized membrane protein